MSEVSVIDFKGTAGKRQVKDKISRDAITSNIETNDTSSKNYNSGEYILWKGVYYKTKVAITSGTTFVVGTNIEETTISDALYDIAGSSGATSLSDLTDTSITSPANGQVLKFNGTTNKWENDDDVEIKTATGNPITLTDAIAGNAIEVSAEIVASQDLHGYEKPWVGGAGKNKLSSAMELGSIDGAGNTYPNNNAMRSANFISVTAGTEYTYSQKSASGEMWVHYYLNGAFVSRANVGENVRTATFTVPSGVNQIKMRCNLAASGVLIGENQLEIGSQATSYEPYSNICPITGFSSVTITDVDAESHTATITVALGQTVYGGTLDLTSGELTITHANIASYNGETIGEPWISSLDEYTQGGTPTTGAQVVYTLATPTTTTLTAAQLALVKGYNQLSCNSGDMSITYKASGLDALKERVEELEDRVDDLTVSDLADTAITTPTNGQVLGYNSTSGKWENQNPSGGNSMSKTRYTISSSNWSASANASGYYTYSLTLTTLFSTSYAPNVYISGASDSAFSTDTEKTQFSYLDECNLSASNILVLYAKTKPTSTFYVYVEGQNA